MVFGALVMAVGLGYFAGMPFAKASWPWSESPFDFLLVSSFLIAAGAVIFWLAAVEEWACAVPATMNVGSMNAGAAAFLYYRFGVTHDGRFLTRAAALTVFALMNLGAFLWSRRQATIDTRPADRVLKLAFTLFTAVLTYAAIQLFRRSPTIFPWPLEPNTEVLIGWLFFGSAVYFAHGLFGSRWHQMRGQLIAFLAYDLMLIVPYLAMFDGVYKDHLPSLIAYVAVILGSMFFSIYYLFINRRTRGWAVTAEAASIPQSSSSAQRS